MDIHFVLNNYFNLFSCQGNQPLTGFFFNYKEMLGYSLIAQTPKNKTIISIKGHLNVNIRPSTIQIYLKTREKDTIGTFKLMNRK